MVTLIFRRRRPEGFSIETLFDALYDRLRVDGVKINRLELPYVSSGLFNVFRNALFVLRSRKGAVIHITGDVHYAGLLCPFLKTVITVHDCIVLQRGRGFKKFVLWLLWFRLPLTFADVVTVISEKTKRELLEVVSIRRARSKIVVVPNFVRPSYIFSHQEFNRAKPRVLHVGTNQNKNLRRVIESLRGIPIVLVIIGALEETLLRYVLELEVEFENHVSVGNPELLKLFQGADIISFPSTYEGFGIPILEGQAIGRPVLTSNIDPMREVAGDGGALLVDPYSVESIRGGFKAIIDDDDLRARLVKHGLANVQKYTLSSVAARYRAIYRSLNES